MPEHEYYYYLCTLYDVSAQYVISPNITTLTIANGVGRDVEFHCQCMDGNGMMIAGTTWLFSNGSSVPTRNLNIPPVVLYIDSPFDISDTGTYTCSPNSMLNDPSGDTITLTAAG